MNKKGFTLIEVITSIVLVSVVLIFMLASLVKIKEAYSIVNQNTDALVYSASITRIINNDFKDNGDIRSVECNEEGSSCDIILNNDSKRKIIIYDNELSKIQTKYKDTFTDDASNTNNGYGMPCDIELKTGLSGSYYCPVKTYASTLKYLDTTTGTDKLLYIKTLKLIKEQDLVKMNSSSSGYIFGKIASNSNTFTSKNGTNENTITKITIQINDSIDFNDPTYDILLYSSIVKSID